jgi:hypothetical protein
MIALVWFVLAVVASQFESKRGLEAENAVLRHQLIVLLRKMRVEPDLLRTLIRQVSTPRHWRWEDQSHPLIVWKTCRRY